VRARQNKENAALRADGKIRVHAVQRRVIDKRKSDQVKTQWATEAKPNQTISSKDSIQKLIIQT
jgi:hypothetical protein